LVKELKGCIKASTEEGYTSRSTTLNASKIGSASKKSQPEVEDKDNHESDVEK
jgi:hypothetical protein